MKKNLILLATVIILLTFISFLMQYNTDTSSSVVLVTKSPNIRNDNNQSVSTNTDANVSVIKPRNTNIDNKTPLRLIIPITSLGQHVLDKDSFQRANRPWIVRYKLIRFDYSSLQIGEKISFDIFDDLALTVIFESRYKASGSSTNEIWQGKILEERLGTVTLVKGEGILVGNIRIPGKNLFEIRYVEDDIHSMREVDISKQPPFADPVIPKRKNKN